MAVPARDQVARVVHPEPNETDASRAAAIEHRRQVGAGIVDAQQHAVAMPAVLRRGDAGQAVHRALRPLIDEARHAQALLLQPAGQLAAEPSGAIDPQRALARQFTCAGLLG